MAYSKLPTVLLSVDPGKATGWALFSNGTLSNMGICRSIDEFVDWLTSIEIPDFIVYENFKLFSHKAVQQSGSTMEASQVIGILKGYARQNKIPTAEQPANVLPIAQKFTQVKMPKNHKDSHNISAYNHGYYWLVKNGFAEPVGG